MLGPKVSCTILIIAVSFLGVLSQVPEPGKYYVIKSTMDGGFIRPVGNGKICTRLSYVETIYGLTPPYPETYKWRVSSSIVDDHIRFHAKVSEEGFMVNQLAFDDYPPFCYLVYREVDVIPHSSSGYLIRNVRTGQCLSSLGSEVGILFWKECGNVGQGWEFIETE